MVLAFLALVFSMYGSHEFVGIYTCFSTERRPVLFYTMIDLLDWDQRLHLSTYHLLQARICQNLFSIVWYLFLFCILCMSYF